MMQSDSAFTLLSYVKNGPEVAVQPFEWLRLQMWHSGPILACLASDGLSSPPTTDTELKSRIVKVQTKLVAGPRDQPSRNRIPAALNRH